MEIKTEIEEKNLIKKDMNQIKYLLVCSMIGPGFLTLPNILNQNGLVLGCFIIILSGFSSLYGSFIWVRCLNYYKHSKTYNELVGLVLNFKFKIFASMILFTYLIFSITAFLKIFLLILSNLLSKFYFKMPSDDKFFILNLLLIILFISIFISISNLDSLKKVSFYINMSVLYICFVIIYQMTDYNNYFNKVQNYKIFDFNINIISNFGLGLFSFTNQFVIINILSKLNVNKIEADYQINKFGKYSIILRSYFFPICIYTITSFASNISIGSHYDQIIINRKPINKNSDYLMIIGQFVMLFNLIIGISIRIISNKELGLEIVNDILTDKNKNKTNKFIKVFIIFITTFIPLIITVYMDRFIKFLKIISSLTCPIFIFILPIIMDIKCSTNKNITIYNKYNYFKILFSILLIFLCYFSVFHEIINF